MCCNAILIDELCNLDIALCHAAGSRGSFSAWLAVNEGLFHQLAQWCELVDPSPPPSSADPLQEAA